VKENPLLSQRTISSSAEAGGSEAFDTCCRLGIDLGGTKIEALLLGSSPGIADTELFRRRLATPRGDYAGTVAAIKALVHCAREAAAAQGLPAPSIGLGTPGAISLRTGRVKNANSTCLNGQALLQDLERELGCPVRSSNDANCMLLSEIHDGAALGVASAFGVILGTGVGGAVLLNGKLHEGSNRIAGEWGHNPLPWLAPDEFPGPSCYCGRHGCNETWLSGPAFLSDYHRLGGRAREVPELLALLSEGEAIAAHAFDRYCDRLARGLAHVINILDPEVIVLAGGLSNIVALYEDIPKRWGAYVFSDQVRSRLVKSMHGDSSGVRGAARLWP
jgi:fructokinase